MAIHQRKCHDCGNIAEHSDNIVPVCLQRGDVEAPEVKADIAMDGVDEGLQSVLHRQLTAVLLCPLGHETIDGTKTPVWSMHCWWSWASAYLFEL